MSLSLRVMRSAAAVARPTIARTTLSASVRQLQTAALHCSSQLIRVRLRSQRHSTPVRGVHIPSNQPQHQLDPIVSRLSDKSLFQQMNYIDGAFCPSSSGESVQVLNPSTGAIVGSCPDSTDSDIARAIESAHRAGAAWAALPPQQRGKLMMQWHDLIAKNASDLATILTSEQGKPHAEALGEITYANSFIKVFADECAKGAPESYAYRLDDSGSPTAEVDVIYQPVGAVACITPWNFPAAMFARKLAAALAAGCTATLKPSEATPFTAFAFAELARRARIPKGVFNCITGDAKRIGASFSHSPLIKKLSFTGSTGVGKLLLQQSATNLTRLSLELGGNAPFVVFADVSDLDAAVAGLVACKLRNMGQTCVTANRILVQRSIYDEFCNRLHKAMQKQVIGDGFAGKQVNLGPLINQSAVDKTHAHVQDALSKGGKLLLGGYSLRTPDDIARAKQEGIDASRVPMPNAAGLFYAPALIRDCTPEMQVWREETFGPVAALFPFDTEADAIRLANDTIYGLASYVYTGDAARGERMSRALEYGMTTVSLPTVSLPKAPFGGIKQSGTGREGGGAIGMKDYLNVKTIHTAVTRKTK